MNVNYFILIIIIMCLRLSIFGQQKTHYFQGIVTYISTDSASKRIDTIKLFIKENKILMLSLNKQFIADGTTKRLLIGNDDNWNNLTEYLIHDKKHTIIKGSIKNEFQKRNFKILNLTENTYISDIYVQNGDRYIKYIHLSDSLKINFNSNNENYLINYLLYQNKFIIKQINWFYFNDDLSSYPSKYTIELIHITSANLDNELFLLPSSYSIYNNSEENLNKFYYHKTSEEMINDNDTNLL